MNKSSCMISGRSQRYSSRRGKRASKVRKNKTHNNNILLMTSLQDNSIPAQSNHKLPLRSLFTMAVRNHSGFRDKANLIKDNFVTSETSEKINVDDSFGSELTDIDDERNINNSMNSTLSYSHILSNDVSSNSNNHSKRKYDNFNDSNLTKDIKVNQTNCEILENENKLFKSYTSSTNPDKIYCVKKVELQTDKEEFSTSNMKSIKVVPPLRLKKVVEEVTIDQQKQLSGNDHFASETEMSNYRIISDTSPVPKSTKVSTTLTSNTTSFVPQSYIDNIRITIPTLPKLGIQESYEITGPNFIATMTSKITNTSGTNSKRWQNSTIRNSPIFVTHKFKDKLHPTSNDPSLTIFNSKFNDLHSTSKLTDKITEKVAPNMKLSKKFENPCISDDSVMFSTEDDKIKLEQVVEESNDNDYEYLNNLSATEMNNETNRIEETKNTEEFELEKSENLILVDNDLVSTCKSDMNEEDDVVCCDEKILRYRQSKMQFKLDELKNKFATELQNKDDQNRNRFQQMIDVYEKQIEKLSQLLKKLSSYEYTLKNNIQLERSNFNLQKRLRRSPSLSPPKLSPKSVMIEDDVKSPSEIRNSPPILPKINVTSPGVFEVACESQNIDNKTLILNTIDFKKLDNDQMENIASGSNSLIESIYVKDEDKIQPFSRRRIEIHDDDCVEVTLLMKPTSNKADKVIENVEYENYTSYKFMQDFVSLEQNSLNSEIEDTSNQILLNEDESNTESPIIVVDKDNTKAALDQRDLTVSNSDSSSIDLLNQDLSVLSDFNVSDKKLSADNNQIFSNMYYENMPVDLTISAQNFDKSNPKDQVCRINIPAKEMNKTKCKKAIAKKNSSNISSITMKGQGELPRILNDNSYNAKLDNFITTTTRQSDQVAFCQIPREYFEINVNNINNSGLKAVSQQPTVCTASYVSDSNLYPKLTTLPTPSLSTVCTTSPLHSGSNYSLINIMNNLQNRESSNKKNEINIRKTVGEPIVLSNHKSRAVNQSKSTVTQNLQSPTINSNVISSNKNIAEKNVLEQFPTFGNWATKITHKESGRHKKKLSLEQRPTSLQNLEVTRSNYMIGNIAYVPRWNTEKPIERTHTLQHAESIPIQNTMLPSRQRFFPSVPLTRFYSGEYAVDPYSTSFNYNTTYPYTPNLSYSSVQGIPSLEVQRMPFESLRNLSCSGPTILDQQDKRLTNFSEYKNLSEFVRIPNPLTHSNLERHLSLSTDYQRPTYNNCSILMEPQYSRPIYKEPNVNQYEVETSNFVLNQATHQKKQIDYAFTQSRLLREQQIKTANFRNVKLRNESCRPTTHEFNPVSSAEAITSTVSTTVINNSAIYTANHVPIKDPNVGSRTCETPNLGKIPKSPNSAQNLRCFNCGAFNSIFQCLGCEIAVYCNEACQTQHWTEHVAKCPKIMPKLKKVA